MGFVGGDLALAAISFSMVSTRLSSQNLRKAKKKAKEPDQEKETTLKKVFFCCLFIAANDAATTLSKSEVCFGNL